MKAKVRSAGKGGSDTHPDAWQRFEKAVDIGLHTKPMHKPNKVKTRKKARRSKP
jgi:hypothetical protein